MSPLHRLFWSHKSHVLPKSRPQLRHDREVSHHLSRRPREMSTMLPCVVFCGLLTRVSIPIWHKTYGSLAFPSQSHATNFVKFEETKRELRNCETAIFMNLFIDFRHQFIRHNGRSATSLFIVNIRAAIFKHNAPLPYSAFTHSFPYTLQSCR